MFECEKYRVYSNNLFEVIKESAIILSDCNRENVILPLTQFLAIKYILFYSILFYSCATQRYVKALFLF